MSGEGLASPHRDHGAAPVPSCHQHLLHFLEPPSPTCSSSRGAADGSLGSGPPYSQNLLRSSEEMMNRKAVRENRRVPRRCRAALDTMCDSGNLSHVGGE